MATGTPKAVKAATATGTPNRRPRHRAGVERPKQVADTTGQAGAGAKLSTEQRPRSRRVIREQHVQPGRPTSTSRFRSEPAFPARCASIRSRPKIVTIYPEWRGYEFFLVRDQIVVVDPRTLEIVAVLEA